MFMIVMKFHADKVKNRILIGYIKQIYVFSVSRTSRGLRFFEGLIIIKILSSINSDEKY